MILWNDPLALQGLATMFPQGVRTPFAGQKLEDTAGGEKDFTAAPDFWKILH
jgi:hypothetical protein